MTDAQKLEGMEKLIRILWEELHPGEHNPWPGNAVAALKLLVVDAQQIRKMIRECELAVTLPESHE